MFKKLMRQVGIEVLKLRELDCQASFIRVFLGKFKNRVIIINFEEILPYLN